MDEQKKYEVIKKLVDSQGNALGLKILWSVEIENKIFIELIL